MLGVLGCVDQVVEDAGCRVNVYQFVRNLISFFLPACVLVGACLFLISY